MRYLLFLTLIIIIGSSISMCLSDNKDSEGKSFYRFAVSIEPSNTNSMYTLLIPQPSGWETILDDIQENDKNNIRIESWDGEQYINITTKDEYNASFIINDYNNYNIDFSETHEQNNTFKIYSFMNNNSLNVSIVYEDNWVTGSIKGNINGQLTHNGSNYLEIYEDQT